MESATRPSRCSRLPDAVPDIATAGIRIITSRVALDPVRSYLTNHSAGLPLSPDGLWTAWKVSGVALFVSALRGGTSHDGAEPAAARARAESRARRLSAAEGLVSVRAAPGASMSQCALAKYVVAEAPGDAEAGRRSRSSCSSSGSQRGSRSSGYPSDVRRAGVRRPRGVAAAAAGLAQHMSDEVSQGTSSRTFTSAMRSRP